MTVHVVNVDDSRAGESLKHAMRHLLTVGVEAKDLTLSDDVRLLDPETRRVEQRFQHTPEPLLASWRAARQLASMTEPGDVVVMSDHGGLGGVFALDQAAADPTERRQLWTVAADSAFLGLRLVAKTHEGLPLPLDSQVDWEIVQYRWSQRVIASSPLAVTELAGIGVTAELIGEPAPAESDGGRPDPRHIWAPGPVSRRNQTGEVLRALTSLPAARITLSDEDTEDAIWTSSTWDALRHSREVLGGRVERRARPSERPTAIVLGDPYALPDPAVAVFRAEGIPVVVPRGGVASLIWPTAPTWDGADDLAQVLAGAESDASNPPAHPVTRWRSEIGAYRASERVREVSVAIPVFRDVRFLEECVDSVLGQELPPLEVLLVDDGSRSDEVDRVFADLTDRDRRVRTLHIEHRGVCAARNTAMEAMQGDTFLFVDSDDILLPTFLSRCAQALDSHENIWAAATWTEFFGSYEAIEAKPPFDERVGRRENPIISTSALVDARVREAGIRFASDLAFLFCEDWHFWSQIVAAGGALGLVPEALAKHRVHAGSGGYMRTELAHAIGRSRATEPLRRPRS
jgi:hypothetical protein